MQYIDNSEILIIINPNSGKGKISKIINSIKKIDARLFYVVTNNTDDVKDVFTKYLKKYKVFLIVGGDGSVNEIIKYLQNCPQKYLSVYPNGSGNGFARELGFKKNLKSLINDINKGDSMELDLLKTNNTFSINTLGIGIDSYVAHEFSKTKNRGLINYILLTIKSFFVFKSFNAKVNYGEFETHGIFQMITIANTRQFGNNAFIAPKAKPNDGLIDLVLVKPFPFYLYPYFVLKLFLGLLKQSKYVDYIKTNKPISIESKFNKYHVDGEPLTFRDKLEVSIDRSKIKIIKTAHNTQ